MPDHCNFKGLSGQGYQYFVYDFGSTFDNDEPGNYAVTKRDASMRHTVLYFGETDSLKNRCCGTHEKWEAASRLGATHILAHFSSASKEVRRAEESDVVARYKPPLNK